MLASRERICAALAASLGRAAADGLPDIPAAAAGGACCSGGEADASGAEQVAAAVAEAAAAAAGGEAAPEFVGPEQLLAEAWAAGGQEAGEAAAAGAAGQVCASGLIGAARGDQRQRRASASACGAATDAGGEAEEAALWGAAAARLVLGGWCPISLGAALAGQPADVTAGSNGGAGDAPAGERIALSLRPADPRLGAVRFRGALWGFSSVAAATAFLAAPGDALGGAAAAATAGGPLLQHLLALPALPPGALPPPPPAAAGGAGDGATAASAAASGEGGDGPVWAPPLRWLLGVASARLRADAGTQTPTHFVESRIVRDYEWNEWALRRRVGARWGWDIGGREACPSGRAARAPGRRETGAAEPRPPAHPPR
jgi:hypothetical protein